MDTSVDIRVLLKPIWFDRFPTCRIGINDQLHDLVLVEPIWVNLHSEQSASLVIQHYGKTDADTDTNNNQDTAIIIEQIYFNEIISPKFVWNGLYYPDYPPHIQSGESPLKCHSYLGWNGIWTLDFTLPIYTWIHNTENLGWIYD